MRFLPTQRRFRAMRMVIQRVQHAKVEIENKVAGAIEAGLLVLLGIADGDSDDDIQWLVRKLTQLRVFSDDEGKMNHSVTDIRGGILVVSQFTLYADCKKGNRPSYIRSAHPDVAIPIYERFLDTLKANFSGPIGTGQFGAMMEITLLNDGPVTIILDSRQRDF